MAVGSFVSVGRSLDDAVARVRLAEELGYDAAYVTHIAGRDSLTVLAGYAAATSRIGLGTGVVPIYTRTPATMAHDGGHAATSSPGGACAWGWASRTAPVVEGWHGQTIDRPVAEMREYVAIVRAILARRAAARRREVADELRAQRHRPATRTCRSTSPRCRRRCCASPARSPTASMLWLCNPRVHPRRRRARGDRRARARRQDAGRLRGRGRRARRPSSTTPRPPARRCAATCCPYFGLPFYRAMLERSGFGEDIAAYDEAAAERRRRGDAGGDLRSLPARAVRDRLGRGRCAPAWRATRTPAPTLPCVGPIAKTDFEATLRAAAPG